MKTKEDMAIDLLCEKLTPETAIISGYYVGTKMRISSIITYEGVQKQKENKYESRGGSFGYPVKTLKSLSKYFGGKEFSFGNFKPIEWVGNYDSHNFIRVVNVK